MANLFFIFFKRFTLFRLRLLSRLVTYSLLFQSFLKYKSFLLLVKRLKRLLFMHFFRFRFIRDLFKFKLRFLDLKNLFNFFTYKLLLFYKKIKYVFFYRRGIQVIRNKPGRAGFLQRQQRRVLALLPREKRLRKAPLSLFAFNYYKDYKFRNIIDERVGSSFFNALFYHDAFIRIRPRRKKINLSYVFSKFINYRLFKISRKRRFILVSNWVSLSSRFFNFFNYSSSMSFVKTIILLKNRFINKFGYLYSAKHFRFFLSNNIFFIFNNLVRYNDRLVIERRLWFESLKKKMSFIFFNFSKFFTTPKFDSYQFNDFFAKPFSFFSYLYLGNRKKLQFFGSRFIDSFLLNRAYTVLLSNYSDLDTVNYSIYNNFRMHKALSFFFSQNDLFFSPRTDFIIRDGIKVDPVSNSAVFNFDKVNFSKNSFFKSMLLKYKKIYLFCSSLNVKLLILLLPNNKLKLKFIFDKFYYNLKRSSNINFFKYKLLKTIFMKELVKISNNNIISFSFKLKLFNQIKDWYFNNLSKSDFFGRKLYKWCFNFSLKSDKVKTSNFSFIENTILRKPLHSTAANNYYIDYSLISANLRYFFISNFHLGFQKNRWDPNFIHYYWGVRRNYMILNLNRTWLNFKFLAFNIWDCLKYRLPVLFVNQNRLIDMFVCKTFHSLGLLNSVAVSGYRWLGGTLSNIKDVCGVQPGFSKSLYKVSINLMSTKYIRSAISLFPIGVSLNNIKNYWFINELNNINVKSHSVVDSNGVLIYPENIIVGNTLSLSSNVFFLNVCRLIVDSCLKKERLYFTNSKVLDILPNDLSQLVQDDLFASSLYPVARRKLQKAFYRFDDRVLFYNSTRALKFSLHNRFYSRKDYKLKNRFLRKVRDLNISFKFNKKALKNIRKTPIYAVQSSNYRKGQGTFFSYLRRAKVAEKNRILLLIVRGFKEFIPLNSYESLLLKNAFSIKLKNQYIFDYIEYILHKYVMAIKNYRLRNLKNKK